MGEGGGGNVTCKGYLIILSTSLYILCIRWDTVGGGVGEEYWVGQTVEKRIRK